MYQFQNFFKDKQGNVVLFQAPNSPLLGFFLFTILNFVWSSHQPKAHALFAMLSFGFIFTWAWLEIISGVNGFRRLFGLVVLLLAVWIYWT